MPRLAYKRFLPAIAVAMLHVARALASAQTALPVVKSITVESSVSVASGNILTYSYKVSNPSQNSGAFWFVALDIRKPQNAASLVDAGLNSDEGLTTALTQLVLAQIGKDLVPVGVLTPLSWRSSLSLSGTV